MHFLDDQRRHRRASWRFSLFAVVAVALAGLPLCLLISPPLFGLILIGARVVDLVIPLPDTLFHAMEQIARLLPNTYAAITGTGPWPSWTLVVTALVLPGAALMFGMWIWIRVLFRRVGAGGVLMRLRARPPNREVLAELQLINIVEEVAIAAGVRPPRVMVMDSPAANAAAVGLSVDDATILVSGGLLELDRDSRQAILAHVVASIANGDLKIASIILSVFQTWGLLALVIDLTFGPRSRRAVRQFVAVSRRALRSGSDRRLAARMLDRLMDGASMSFDDLLEHIEISEGTPSLWRAVFISLPLWVVVGPGAITSKAVIALFTLLVLGPWVALMWRARRRLADATAVQLTRHPDALARAVKVMEGRDVAVEHGDAVSFLFPFWTRWTPQAPERADVMAHVVGTQLDFDKRLASLRALGASPAVASIDASTASQTPPTRARELLMFLGWGAVAIALVAACLAFTLGTATGLLWALWEWLAPGA